MPMHRELNHDFFKKWSHEMAYVLGFFAADGNMIKNRRGAHFVAFYSCDRKLLSDVRRTMASSHKVGKRTRRPPWRTAYQLQIGSKEVFGDLIELGFTPAKSKKLAFPFIPKKYFGDFVRGYFDGDGCVYFKRHFVKARKKLKWIFTSRFTAGSKDFLNSLLLTLRTHGIQGGFILAKSKNSGYELVLSHHDSVALYRIMYHTAPTSSLFLPRKRKKLERAIRVLGLKMRE